MKSIKILLGLFLISSSLFLQGLQFTTPQEIVDYLKENRNELKVERRQSNTFATYLADLASQEYITCIKFFTNNSITCGYGKNNN